jgi:hypothetical protein
VRYYWPSVLQICNSPEIATELPSRYQDPPYLSRYLPMLRETATTVAASALLPDFAYIKSRDYAHLTFDTHTVMRNYGGEDIKYDTDTVTFNI